MAFVTMKEIGKPLPPIEIRTYPQESSVQPKIHYLSEQELADPLFVWAIFQAKNMPSDHGDKIEDIGKNLRENILKCIEDYGIDFPVKVGNLVSYGTIIVSYLLPYKKGNLSCEKMEIYHRGTPVQLEGYDDEAVFRAFAEQYSNDLADQFLKQGRA